MLSLPRKLLLIVLLPIFLVAHAVAGEFEPESLIGKDYVSARNSLARIGWIPVRHVDLHSMDWGKEIQQKFPEMDSCAMDRPVCSFSFRKKGKCLRVITSGENTKSLLVNAIVHDCLDGEKQ